MSLIPPTSPPETLHANRPPIKAPGDDGEPQPMPVDPDEVGLTIRLLRLTGQL